MKLNVWSEFHFGAGAAPMWLIVNGCLLVSGLVWHQVVDLNHIVRDIIVGGHTIIGVIVLVLAVFQFIRKRP